jgi:hypothetical protein
MKMREYSHATTLSCRNITDDVAFGQGYSRYDIFQEPDMAVDSVQLPFTFIINFMTYKNRLAQKILDDFFNTASEYLGNPGFLIEPTDVSLPRTVKA